MVWVILTVSIKIYNMKRKSDNKSKPSNSRISIWVIITCIILASMLIGKYLFDQIQLISLNRSFLRATSLITSRNFKDLYDEFEPTTAAVKISEEKYIANYERMQIPAKIERIIHKTYLAGDNGGYIDATSIICLIDTCPPKYRFEIRKTYIMRKINNKWKYLGENNSLIATCERNKPFIIPTEFRNSIDLIVERLNSSNTDYNEVNSLNKTKANEILKFINCLDIQYAETDSLIDNSEGVFNLIANPFNQRYLIEVSPRYKNSDTLITSLLLRHEIEHALSFYNFMSGMNLDKAYTEDNCYGDEAKAFLSGILFFGALKNEERSWLKSKYNSSIEIQGFFDTYNAINGYPGEHVEDQVLNFVRSQPVYQEQCMGRN